MKKLAFITAALVLGACAVARTPDPFPPEGRTPAVQRQLELLSSFLTGTFESIAQAKGEGDLTPVKLRIARLWPERAGEFWFYLEYAKVGSEDQPYLQRIVRVGEDGGEMLEAEYRLPVDGKQLVGEWKKSRPLAGIDPASLREIPGCRMRLGMQQMTLFDGGTIGKACRAHVPEGAYQVSDFYLSSSSLRAWDRGYDPAGKVVWGSPSGPLEFRRIASVPR